MKKTQTNQYPDGTLSLMNRGLIFKGASFTSLGFSAMLLSSLALFPEADGAVIYSNSGDGNVESRVDGGGPWPAVQGTTSWEGNVGEWFGNGGLTTIVLPFELPNLGAVANPFLTADFSVMLHTKGNSTVTNVDLYGVRTSASPAIAGSDFYSGATPDPGATLIQASFLTPSSTAGFAGAPNNSTDATGDANLLNYLNTAYNGGAGAGQFVFLRLSYSSNSYPTGWDAYKITLRDAGQTGEWPVITYTAVPEPGAALLGGLGMLALLRRRRNARLECPHLS